MTFIGASVGGKQVVYTDGKRYLWMLSFIPPLVPLLSYWLYARTGAPIVTLIPALFIFGLIPLFDALVGEDPHNPPAEVVDAMEADPYYLRLARFSVVLTWVSYVAFIAFVGFYDLPWWSYVALLLGVGTIDGGALLIGHELGHKSDNLNRVFGILANNSVGYAHFRVEHNRGHHTWVATPEDPASARFNESIYAFARRELPGALKRGWANEAERLTRRGRSVWSIHNEILVGFALTIAVAAVLIALFGWKVAPFILAHHFMGYYALTQANYVEHYGLKRGKDANGRYLPVEPRHSWNTNHIVSNLTTFHLQRHSDHHANPMRSYQSLRNFDDLPRLPSGYTGMFVLAAIPPLWFRTMNPRTLAWAGGDISKLNSGMDR
ncbi:MAG: alkane 1-monooxygenase [Hyphomicrobiales bacterium]|nr:alkane 1-monooxygenase [Hyphomicrobiales bacterium]